MGAELVPMIVAVLSAVVTVLGLVATLKKQHDDRSARIVDDERETRRDRIADRDAMIDQLQEQIAAFEVREARRDRQMQELEMREKRRDERIATLEHELAIEQAHNLALTEHIRKGRPGPPPPRPVFA